MEKIIGANRLFPLAWMRRGLEVARCVGKLTIGRESGTGFLIADGWVITNHHVLGSEGDCARAKLLMNFEEELDGSYAPTVSYELMAETYRGSEPFDCAAVRVRDRPDVPLDRWSVAKFARTAARVGDFVSIIQHPGGGTKKVALSENSVVNLFEHRLQYETDTERGSSGAPVFNDSWEVVGIHHAGGDLAKDSTGETHYVNEAISVAALRTALEV
jgi:endonuclease G